MRRKQSAPIPRSLDRLRREIEQWRQQQTTRKRLPREFWAQAADLAQQYGVHRTARMLGLKYASLRQHLATKADNVRQIPPSPYRFVELPSGVLTAGSLTCTIELDGGPGATLRMHVQGVTMADLATFAARWRGEQP